MKHALVLLGLVACAPPAAMMDDADDGSEVVVVKHTLAVVSAGGGRVVSTPAGIDCGTDCSELMLEGSEVSLIATPDASHVFLGWSGDCSGTDACKVTLSKDAQVTATFKARRHMAITVVGSGSVTSAPAGITMCTSSSGTCSADFDDGMMVTLTPQPDSGFAFDSWSGDCTGTSACVVDGHASTTATATFVALHTLNVTVGGAAPGQVTSSPAGISNCRRGSGTCGSTFKTNTPVTLTATPDDGYFFAGWTGACSGFAACNVSLSADRSAHAVFMPLVASSNLAAPTGTYQNIHLSSTHGVMTRVTQHSSDDNGYSYWPQISPDGESFVYLLSTVCGGNTNVATIQFDGTGEQCLTTYDNAWAGDPIWSPDGSQIAFISSAALNGDDTPSTQNLWIVGASGNDLHPLTSGTGPVNSWLEDQSWFGREILYQSSAETFPIQNIWKVNVDTGVNTRLTNCGVDCQLAVWSPDGSHIAFKRGVDIAIMDADGSNQRPIATGTVGMNTKLLFHPDGGSVYADFSAAGPTNLGSAGPAALYRLDVAPSGPVAFVAAGASLPLLTPDHAQLVCELNNQLVVMDFDGSHLNVATTGGASYSPRNNY